MLERYCGAEWQTLEPGRRSRSTARASSSSRSRRAATRRAISAPDAELEASGFVFRDRRPAASSPTSPGSRSLDDDVIARLAASDLVLVDGTFWHDDDLARLGISDRTARDMGHTPLAGPGGTLEVLAGLERPRKVLVHINNTNPILLEDSPERRAGRPGGRRSRLRWPRGRAVSDEFIARLRAQGARYHNLHPFHVRMDAGELTREELQRWVANRFYYQKCIPLKDAAILANCPEVEVRREWIQRIVDHDGTAEGTGGTESWLRLGEALGVTRDELTSERRRPARGALRGRRLRELRAPEALDRGGRVVAHRAVRAGGDARAARGARAPLPVDRPRGARVLPHAARAGAARRAVRARPHRRALPDARAAGRRRGGAALQDRDAVGAARRDRARRHAAAGAGA